MHACFEVQVRTVLSYGAEIWGPDALYALFEGTGYGGYGTTEDRGNPGGLRPHWIASLRGLSPKSTHGPDGHSAIHVPGKGGRGQQAHLPPALC